MKQFLVNCTQLPTNSRRSVLAARVVVPFLETKWMDFETKRLDNKKAPTIVEALKIVEDIGVEPMTLCVQGRCSSQLS